jgi:hypothetical protein
MFLDLLQVNHPGFDSPKYPKWAEMWNEIPLHMAEGYHNLFDLPTFDAELEREEFQYIVENA